MREGMAVRRKLIRRLVTDVLTKNAVAGPPVPLEKIVRSLGADLKEEATTDDLSGFLLRDVRRNKAVIGVNSSHHEVRRRFTIAHEIGHLLLHEGERLHIDSTGDLYQIKRRDSEASLGTNTDEKEANLFAAELLMPVSFIEQDLDLLGGLDAEDGKAMDVLARKYRVSVQSLTFRLAYLGYVVLG
jgi:Zn-dependent peptidase ImmA (M78 family)